MNNENQGNNLEKLWEDLAKPKDVEKHLSNNPKKLVFPWKDKIHNYYLKNEWVDRFEKYVGGSGEKALVYMFETEVKRYVKPKGNSYNLPEPTIFYYCFASDREQIQIHGLESGPYKLSSEGFIEDELLKSEKDAWISNMESFVKSGNRGILELINYVNPGTNFRLNPSV